VYTDEEMNVQWTRCDEIYSSRRATLDDLIDVGM